MVNHPNSKRGTVVPFPQHENIGTSAMKYDDYLPNIYNSELKDYRQEQSASLEGQNMDNNELLNRYIEKFDRDQSDLRQDIRESEKRINERTMAVEERMDNRLNRIEDLIQSQITTMNQKFDGADKKIDTIKTSVDQKIDNVKMSIDSTNKWIIGMAITVMIGVAAIVVTVFIALYHQPTPQTSNSSTPIVNPKP